MPRYVIDPVTGQKVKVSGTEYIPPCLARTEARQLAETPVIQTETVIDETGNEEADRDPA